MVIDAFEKFLAERKALMLAPSAAGHASVEDLKADLIELIGEVCFQSKRKIRSNLFHLNYKSLFEV